MSEKLLLGTYTRRASEGIYEANLNHTTKQIEDVNLLAPVGNPSYLVPNKKGTVIYSILSEDGQGGIISLTYDGKQWSRRVAHLTDGPAPCYLSYDEEHQLIFTANYHAGSVHIYQTNEIGDLDLLDTVNHKGSSIHANQQSPHAHFFERTPDGRYAVACDLGTDEVYTYEVTDEGKLNEVARLSVKPGTGPRHLVFHPTLPKAYILGELSSEVLVADYDAQTGRFQIIDIVPTIPATHTDFNSGAAIRITTDGKHLYTSNRGHHSLVAFEILPDGRLDFIAYYRTDGETPRDFNLSEDERFIVVGHQDTDYLTLFERDQERGKLQKIQDHVPAPEVVCVTFIPVDTVQV